MSRKLLYILLIILPFLLYGIYAWWAKRQARRAGTGGDEGVWNDAPWVRLASAGILLFIIALVMTALLGGESTEGTYVPPRVIDGEIAPGEVK